MGARKENYFAYTMASVGHPSRTNIDENNYKTIPKQYLLI